MNLIEILEWDTNHFGFKVARMNATTSEELQPALDRCATSGVKLLIHRCSTDNLHFVHQLEKQGFQLMDTMVYYRLSLADTQITPVPGPAIIRPCLKTEADDVAAIARAVYVDFIGHFHQDPRLDRAKCDALYVEWARNACLNKNLADIMFVAEMEGKIVGFDSHKIIQGKTGWGVISGVSNEAQGKGIRTALMFAGMNWCKSQGLEYMEADVHVNHYQMHRVYAGHGFKMYASFYTFHRWF